MPAAKSKRARVGQKGGNGEPSAPMAAPSQAPAISQETLQQAGKMAQQLLNNAMSPQGNGSGQVGGSADPAAALPAGGAAAPPAGGAAPPGLQAAMTAGAVGGAVAGAEAYTSLHSSPLMGGGRRRRSRSRIGRGKKGAYQPKNDTQSGGMVPGLMTAVETALVPLGLYIGQKTLQSRRAGKGSSLGKSFSFRRDSRRTRRRR